MIDPNLDGVTHINIYSQGKTELGRMLSNFYRYDFECENGKFKSIEAYWYWLGINDCKEKEVLRNLYGYQAKKKGEELKSHFGKKLVDNFEQKILDAIWIKVKNNKNLILTELGMLPLEHYYNFGGKVVNVKNKYLWLIEGIDKMRNQVIYQGR